MNYMEHVAELLGVELEEEFLCENGITYKLTNIGIVRMDDETEDCRSILVDILNSRLSIERKPWKPNIYTSYFYVDLNNKIWEARWTDSCIDYLLYKTGNCYRTKAAAQENVEKWMAFYASKEVLKI